MFGMPLHPQVVHFPVVLAVLLPIVALVALWMIKRGSPTRRTWWMPFVFAVALAISAWVAVQTGKTEEDKVRKITPRGVVHTHEEAGERLMIFSGILCIVFAAGLATGKIGQIARVVSTVSAIALVAAAVQAGHTGGLLVYQHGAARAYTDSTLAPTDNRP